jgi:hypothetical protein
VAELVVRDRAGNLATRSWSFEVRERHDRYGNAYGHAYGSAYGRRG